MIFTWFPFWDPARLSICDGGHILCPRKKVIIVIICSSLCTHFTSYYDSSRKEMYVHVIHSLHFVKPSNQLDTPWHGVLVPPLPVHPSWESFDLYPTPRMVANLSLRLLHEASSSGALLQHFTNFPDRCCFCGETETIFHVHLQYLRQAVFVLFARENPVLTLLVSFFSNTFYFWSSCKGGE